MSSFSASELSTIYEQLFLLRFKNELNDLQKKNLLSAFTEFKDLIFGRVLLMNGMLCAYDLIYKVECPNWFYFEDFNGGDPQYNFLSVGSVLIWENVQEAKIISKESGRKCIFSLGAFNPACQYKNQWCEILPSGRVIF